VDGSNNIQSLHYNNTMSILQCRSCRCWFYRNLAKIQSSGRIFASKNVPGCGEAQHSFGLTAADFPPNHFKNRGIVWHLESCAVDLKYIISFLLNEKILICSSLAGVFSKTNSEARFLVLKHCSFTLVLNMCNSGTRT